MNGNDQIWNDIDTLVTKTYGKKDNKIDINITKEEDGVIIFFNGVGHQGTIT
jgi:hypothetical protein